MTWILLSHMELNPNTYREIWKVIPGLGKAVSCNDILSHNIPLPEKSNVPINHFPKAYNSTHYERDQRSAAEVNEINSLSIQSFLNPHHHIPKNNRPCEFTFGWVSSILYQVETSPQGWKVSNDYLSRTIPKMSSEAKNLSINISSISISTAREWNRVYPIIKVKPC